MAPPVTNKMFKGLLVCYAVVVTTFFSVAISGYWAFGNQAAGYILTNLAPSDGPALVPSWLIVLTNMFTLAQIIAVALVRFLLFVPLKSILIKHVGVCFH